MSLYSGMPWKNRSEYLRQNPDVCNRLKRDEALTAELVREDRANGRNLKQPSDPGRQRL
jgi:hypothetical protein